MQRNSNERTVITEEGRTESHREAQKRYYQRKKTPKRTNVSSILKN
jgi:hypothetical protein